MYDTEQTSTEDQCRNMKVLQAHSREWRQKDRQTLIMRKKQTNLLQLHQTESLAVTFDLLIQSPLVCHVTVRVSRDDIT